MTLLIAEKALCHKGEAEFGARSSQRGPRVRLPLFCNAEEPNNTQISIPYTQLKNLKCTEGIKTSSTIIILPYLP
jgi:hypothetical protein